MGFLRDRRFIDRIEAASGMLGMWARAGGNAEVLREMMRADFRNAATSATTLSDTDAPTFGSGLGALLVAAMEHGPGAWPTIASQSRRAAFRTPIFTGSGLTATLTAEGASFRVREWGVAAGGLTPQKVGAIAVLTREAMQTEQGRAGVILDLAEAITTATDAQLVALLAAGGWSASASADPLHDLRVLLASVSLTAFSAPHFLLSPATASTLATWSDVPGLFAFPGITPLGGDLFGVPVLVTAGAGDSVAIVDCRGLVTGDSSATVSVSEAASIELDDAPAQDSATPAAASGAVVSLFQADCLALLGAHHFAARLLRGTAAAVLTDVAWSQAETT